MIEIRTTAKFSLCCRSCRGNLESDHVEPSRGGRPYDWVIPVDTCTNCQEDQLRRALREAKKSL